MATSAQAVLFDVYGTLVEIPDPRRPFRELLRLAMERDPRLDRRRCARELMTAPVSLQSAASGLGLRLSASEQAFLEESLAADLNSARLFPDVIDALTVLREMGVRIGLCSNLAHPYVAPALRLLSSYVDAHVWSCEAGFIKPEREIYLLSAVELGVTPDKVLMVGDNVEADVNGPVSAGMRAVLIRRTQTGAAEPCVTSLDGVFRLVAASSSAR